MADHRDGRRVDLIQAKFGTTLFSSAITHKLTTASLRQLTEWRRNTGLEPWILVPALLREVHRVNLYALHNPETECEFKRALGNPRREAALLARLRLQMEGTSL